MSARDNILGRIRAANGKAGGATPQERDAVVSRLRAHARGPLPTMDWEPLPRFKERCIVMMSYVDQIASRAELPKDRPIFPEDIKKTVYYAMRIDNLEAQDKLGRDYNLLDEGKPLTELFG